MYEADDVLFRLAVCWRGKPLVLFCDWIDADSKVRYDWSNNESVRQVLELISDLLTVGKSSCWIPLTKDVCRLSK